MGDFWATRGGQMFLEGTVPKLIRVLERIADRLEKEKLQRPKSAAFPQCVDALCEGCKTGFIPGAIFPIAADGSLLHAYVERCDECKMFSDDVAACLAVACMLGKDVAFDSYAHPYVTGFTFNEAGDIARFTEASEPDSPALTDRDE